MTNPICADCVLYDRFYVLLCVYVCVYRYSDMMNILFVTFTFSSSMPILLPFAAIYFGLQYAIDKFCLLRLYRTPPTYSALLSSKVRTHVY